MKPLPLLLFAVATLTAPAVLRAADFEGMVRMKMTGGRGGAHEIEYHVKPGFVRSNIESGDAGFRAAMIMDFAKEQLLILMPDQKMYMVQPLSTVKNAADHAAGEDFTFKKSGEHEEILGYDCVKYIATSEGVTSDLWLTEELGRFGGLGNMGGNPMSRKRTPAAAWEKALAGKDFFPLRVVSHDPKGGEQFRLEATSVEKGPQAASLFAPPADYQKLDLGGMLKGFGFPGKR